MINIYDNSRFISKSELAKMAGVSPSTFTRYLRRRRHILDRMGITPKTQKLPPQAVKYICEDYCIDLPNHLQAPGANKTGHIACHTFFNLKVEVWHAMHL